MEKHFVKFFSPGTFAAEETVKPIKSWNVQKAVEMAHKIKERHGATPYGFVFITKSRNERELDSKITKSSFTYYLGGEVLTLKEAKNNPDCTPTLIQNMVINGWKKILVNNNSYTWTQPLLEGDIVLNYK